MLGRKSIPKDDDDDLDNFLDQVEQKEGFTTKVQSPKKDTKQETKQRPKTAAPKATLPWSGEKDDDDLDDVDDETSKLSGGMKLSARKNNEAELAAKRQRLFGMASNSTEELPKSNLQPKRAQTAPKHENQNVMDGNASMGS